MSNDTAVRSAAFGNPDASDITLGSCNDVDFHVYRIILSLASPIFQDMLSLPQPSISRQIGLVDGKGGSTTIVSLSEDAQSMERFLMFCYPSIDPELETLEEVQRRESMKSEESKDAW